MSETTSTLPTFDLWDGHATTLDVNEPCWRYAGRITELDGGGQSWRFSYRSVARREHDAEYQRMRDFIGGAEQIGEPETVKDEMMMMFGEAALTLYELRPLDVTA